MKKNLLNNLCIAFAVLIFSSIMPVAAGTPAFVILKEGKDIADEAERLTNNGVLVIHRIPPQILVAEFPKNIRPNSDPAFKSVFGSAVSLSLLDPYGPLAIAAGIEWNRKMLKETAARGQGLGAMRALVAQGSLPSVMNLDVRPIGNRTLRAKWDALPGAMYYEIQLSFEPNFSTPEILSRTNQTAVDVPAPFGDGSKRIFARVRGVDSTDEIVMGGWSNAVSLELGLTPDAVSLTAPTPVSPPNQTTTAGFTIILEWDSSEIGDTRVQIARSPNFKDAFIDTVVPDSAFICPSPGLKVKDTLYWRVKKWGDRTSAWTPARELEIGPPHNAHVDALVNPEGPK